MTDREREIRETFSMPMRGLSIALTILLAGCGTASSISKAEAGRVRIVNDANQVRGCQVLGTVADNELEDLQKKAARLGGNVALLTPERALKARRS